MTSSQHDSPESDQSLVKKHKLVRKKRKDADQPRWSERDYYALQWIGEQGVIRFDQLQRLLGLESPDKSGCTAVLSPSATRNAIDRWEAKRLVNSAHIVSKEPKYLWLSNAGFQFVELNLPHYSPKKFDMPYLLACNQARLHMEILNCRNPQEFGDIQKCRFVSDRELRSRHPEQEIHLPSGEFWTEKRGTLAVEVIIEFTEGTEEHMRAYTQAKLGKYSQVWYFALSDLLPFLNETRQKLRAAGVDVSKISIFNADAILIPPSQPKRTKKKRP
jgi:hypothetical protein